MTWDMDHRPSYVDEDELSSIYVYPGCVVDIYEHMDKGGHHFQCPGYDSGHMCDHNDLGYVGNDETSSLTCKCPVEFDRMAFDNPGKLRVIISLTYILLKEVHGFLT